MVFGFWLGVVEFVEVRGLMGVENVFSFWFLVGGGGVCRGSEIDGRGICF